MDDDPPSAPPESGDDPPPAQTTPQAGPSRRPGGHPERSGHSDPPQPQSGYTASQRPWSSPHNPGHYQGNQYLAGTQQGYIGTQGQGYPSQQHGGNYPQFQQFQPPTNMPPGESGYFNPQGLTGRQQGVQDRPFTASTPQTKSYHGPPLKGDQPQYSQQTPQSGTLNTGRQFTGPGDNYHRGEPGHIPRQQFHTRPPGYNAPIGRGIPYHGQDHMYPPMGPGSYMGYPGASFPGQYPGTHQDYQSGSVPPFPQPHSTPYPPRPGLPRGYSPGQGLYPPYSQQRDRSPQHQQRGPSPSRQQQDPPPAYTHPDMHQTEADHDRHSSSTGTDGRTADTPEKEPSRTIKVAGLKTGTDKDTLSLFFESEKRCGGGEIDTLEILGDSALITFSEAGVAARVCQRPTHKFSGSTLTVTVYDESANTSNVVVVTGLDAGMSENVVLMYFENEKRSGGGPVQDVKKQHNAAYVTFEDPGVARRVASRQHEISGKKVKVKLRSESFPRTIAVTGCDPEKDLELVQMYFESEKRSGGGGVQEAKIVKKAIFVQFEEEEVYDRVLSRGCHKVSGKKLAVEPAREEDSDEEADESDVAGDTHDTDSVEVRGYPKDTSDDNITLYFENTKKSGGGDCEVLSRNDKKGIMVLKFGSAEVAKRVASRQHKLLQQELQVRLHVPPEMYKDRVLLTGVPETEGDALNLYLDARSGSEVTGILYGEEEGEMIVTFAETINAISLDKAIKKKPLKKSNIQVATVPKTTSITVRRLPNIASEDQVKLYFENRRRSGGGDVVDWKIFHDENMAVVTFVDADVAEKICKRKHQLSNIPLDVSLHFESLGSAGGSPEPPCTQIPDPFEMTEVDEYVLKFVCSASDVLEGVISHIEERHGRLDVTPTTIRVMPTFLKDDKDARKISKTWRNRVQEVLQGFMDGLVVERIDVNSEIWSSVETKTKELTDQKNVIIITEEQRWQIVIAGEKSEVKATTDKVEVVVQNIQAEHERRKNQRTEMKSFNPGKLRVLLGQGMLGNLSRDYFSVTGNPKTGQVELIGPKKEIDNALFQVFEAINGIAEDSLIHLSPKQLELLARPSVEDYLLNLQHKNDLAAAGSWGVMRDTVIVYYLSEQGPEDMTSFLNSALQERNLTLDRENVALLEMTQFQQMVDSVCTEKEGRVIVTPRPKNILVTGVTDDVDQAVEVIESFIKENTIYTIPLDYNHIVLKFMNLHCQDRLDSICQDLKKYNVQFCWGTGGQRQSVTLKSSKDGIDQAKMFLDAVAGQIKSHKEKLTKPGINTYIETEGVLSQIEKNARCVFSRVPVEGDDDVDTSIGSSLRCEKAFSCKLDGNKEVIVAVGDMAALACDVQALVVDVTPLLEPASCQATSVIDKAGAHVKTELEHRSSFPVSEGDVYCSSPGDLPCARIIHAVGPQHSSDHDRVLTAAVLTSLDKADQQRFQSVALPSFTGAERVSSDVSIKVVMDAAKEFFDETSTSLTIVYICIEDSKEIQSLWSQAVSVFGDGNVVAKDSHTPHDEDPNLRRRRRQGTSRSQMPMIPVAPPDEVDEEPVAPPFPPPVAFEPPPEAGPRILLVKVDMGVEEADVIVNSSNTDLELSKGMVSRSLLQHAGQSIQAECKANYPNGIKTGEIALTKGGDMQCVEQIFHCVLPNYDATTGKQTLTDTLNALLTKADQGKWRTMAIPALGTGNLGYPRDVVADVMYETVTQFGKDNPNTTLCDILFIVYPGDQDSCQVFDAANKKYKLTLGGTVSENQEEIEAEAEAEMIAYREKLIAGKQKRSNPSPASIEIQEKPTETTGTWKRWGETVRSWIPDFSFLTKSFSPTTDTMLWIYTDDQGNVQKALDMIYSDMESRTQTKTIKEESLKKWNVDQIGQLTALEEHGVSITCNKHMGRISLRGLQEDVSEVVPKIMKVIGDVEKVHRDQEYAEELKKVVQWFFLDIDETSNAEVMTPYEPLINAKIERAFTQDQQTELVYQDYVFNFQKWVEYPVDDITDEAKMIRKDLISAASSAIPSTWEDIKDDSSIPQVQKGTPEYQTVEKNVTDCFQAAGTSVEVIRIDRVQNTTLYQQYQAKRQQMEKQGQTIQTEKVLWHGTKQDNCLSICQYGFNRSNCDKSQSDYGEGVYFTTTASDAASDPYAPADAQGKRCLIQSKVLTGAYTQGTKNLRVPPPRDPANRTLLYDSVVNDTANPSIYVIFSDTQAYPEYFITVKC